MKPLFEIGQEVIIVDIRGEVSDENHIIQSWEYIIGAKCNDGSVDTGYFYAITNNPNTGKDWHETCLRPKPKGIGKSYTEFMNELKKDKVVTI